MRSSRTLIGATAMLFVALSATSAYAISNEQDCEDAGCAWLTSDLGNFCMCQLEGEACTLQPITVEEPEFCLGGVVGPPGNWVCNNGAQSFEYAGLTVDTGGDGTLVSEGVVYQCQAQGGKPPKGLNKLNGLPHKLDFAVDQLLETVRALHQVTEAAFALKGKVATLLAAQATCKKQVAAQQAKLVNLTQALKIQQAKAAKLAAQNAALTKKLAALTTLNATLSKQNAALKAQAKAGVDSWVCYDECLKEKGDGTYCGSTCHL